MNSSIVLWEGQSLLNDDPIVVILTGLMRPSTNRKTGPMIQSWVLHQQVTPIHAVKSGKDQAICGNCPLRGPGGCYVDLRTVNAIWRAYKQGTYPKLSGDDLSLIAALRRPLRITSYGDAAATPFEVWEPLLEACPRHTGYTHQWRTCDRRWQKYLLASIEDAADIEPASQAGWRTARVLASEEQPTSTERICLHDEDNSVLCYSCNLCDGAGHKPNIAFPVHGLDYKINNFNKQHAKTRTFKGSSHESTVSL